MRIAIINTESGYRVRPAYAFAHAKDKVRFLNLIGEDIEIELPAGLVPVNSSVQPPYVFGDGDQLDVKVDLEGAAARGGKRVRNLTQKGKRRCQLHYSVYRAKNQSLIPGESSPEIIIDEEA